jgi:hypothetical protein
MTNDKIPKGFIKHLDLNLDWDYSPTTDWIKQNEILVLPISIYDKRMMKITKYILEAEYRYWSVEDTNHIQKIINGGGDGKE